MPRDFFIEYCLPNSDPSGILYVTVGSLSAHRRDRKAIDRFIHTAGIGNRCMGNVEYEWL